MVKHECRFQLHAEHYKAFGDTCEKCKELTASGEWGPYGGRDDYMCRHTNCGYFSSSPRPANRKQAVERHEVAFPIHFNHWVSEHLSCTLCRELLENDIWNERDGDQWLSKGNNQVIARLTTKEQQNGNLPHGTPLGRGLTVAAHPRPRKQPVKKGAKRKRDDDVDVGHETAEALFGLYILASACGPSGTGKALGDATLEPDAKRCREGDIMMTDPVASASLHTLAAVHNDIAARQDAEMARKERRVAMRAQILSTLNALNDQRSRSRLAALSPLPVPLSPGTRRSHEALAVSAMLSVGADDPDEFDAVVPASVGAAGSSCSTDGGGAAASLCHAASGASAVPTSSMAGDVSDEVGGSNPLLCWGGAPSSHCGTAAAAAPPAPLQYYQPDAGRQTTPGGTPMSRRDRVQTALERYAQPATRGATGVYMTLAPGGGGFSAMHCPVPTETLERAHGLCAAVPEAGGATRADLEQLKASLLAERQNVLTDLSALRPKPPEACASASAG